MTTTTEKLNKQELLTSYDETISELLQLLSSFDEQKLNTVPFEGSWTAGRVTEHLLKSGIAIAQILKGNTRPTEGPADEKAETLEIMFLDFTKKLKAAQNVMPSEEPKEKEKLTIELKAKIKNNSIDEFRFMINLVTLGSGKPFFYTKISLHLLKTKVFDNGNVLLCYRPVK